MVTRLLEICWAVYIVYLGKTSAPPSIGWVSRIMFSAHKAVVQTYQYIKAFELIITLKAAGGHFSTPELFHTLLTLISSEKY